MANGIFECYAMRQKRSLDVLLVSQDGEKTIHDKVGTARSFSDGRYGFTLFLEGATLLLVPATDYTPHKPRFSVKLSHPSGEGRRTEYMPIGTGYRHGKDIFTLQVTLGGESVRLKVQPQRSAQGEYQKVEK